MAISTRLTERLGVSADELESLRREKII